MDNQHQLNGEEPPDREDWPVFDTMLIESVKSEVMRGDTHFSAYREMLLEHLFVGALLRHFWVSGSVHKTDDRVELLTSQVDDSGYDLVLEAKGIMRHVQLKSSSTLAKTARVPVNVALAEKPSGCVIWLRFDPDTLDLGPFLWFGEEPGAPLLKLKDCPLGKRTTPNSAGLKPERRNIRVVKQGAFTRLNSIAEVATALFG